MLNIDELIINYIILNYQINKFVIRVISYYPIINWIVFELVILYSFILRVQINEYMLLTKLTNII